MSTLYVDNLEPNLGSRVMAAGHVVQVVNGTDATYFDSTSSSYTENTNMRLSITPTSATSKIFVQYNVSARVYATGGNQSEAHYRITRDGTAISGKFNLYTYDYGGHAVQPRIMQTFAVMDAPNTTDSVQYSVEVALIDGNAAGFSPGAETSTITLMEIAQ